MLSCLNRGRFRASGELTSVDRLREVFRVSGIDEFRALQANEPMLVLPEFSDKKLTVEEFFWRDEYFNSQGPDSLLSYLFSPEQIQRYLNVRRNLNTKAKRSKNCQPVNGDLLCLP
jgi:hypothetical protein